MVFGPGSCRNTDRGAIVDRRDGEAAAPGAGYHVGCTVLLTLRHHLITHGAAGVFRRCVAERHVGAHVDAADDVILTVGYARNAIDERLGQGRPTHAQRTR